MPYFFKVFAFYVGLQYLRGEKYRLSGILDGGCLRKRPPFLNRVSKFYVFRVWDIIQKN